MASRKNPIDKIIDQVVKEFGASNFAELEGSQRILAITRTHRQRMFELVEREWKRYEKRMEATKHLEELFRYLKDNTK